MIVSENVTGYFSRGAAHAQADEIKLLLFRLRSYVGGHIYPLMWLAEQLVPKILEGESAKHAIELMFSSDFRDSEGFKYMRERIVPDIHIQVFRALFTMNPDAQSPRELQRYGFCDQSNKVISQLLFDAYVQSMTGKHPFPGQLGPGVGGVQQLLQFALPNMNSQQYNAQGGPVEDAMTFELMLILSRVAHLGTRLFNPKLINFAAGRKPDLYLNTSVDAYVEAVLTKANSDSERKKLDEHISRFYWEKYADPLKHSPPAYYQITSSDCAILNYQTFGTEPMLPFDPLFFKARYLANESLPL
jgi:hypothetical protein